MSYSRRPTLIDKIVKLIQLHWLYLRARGSKKKLQIAASRSVLMVVPQADRVGGYERQALQLARSLSLGGMLVTLVTDHSAGASDIELRDGFAICRLGGSSVRLAGSLFRFLLRYRKRIHLVHVHGVTGFSLLAVRLASGLGKPVLLKPATEGDLQAISGPSFKNRLYRSWLRRADRFVAVSEELKKEMQSCSLPEERIVRLPNFVDASRFTVPSPERKRTLRARFSIAPEELVFLYVGRLVQRKGVDYLLRAWRDVPRGLLWIAGTGEEEGRLRELSRELGLDRVRFQGAMDHPEDLYACADIFVLPSLKEGFPNVLLEAMSCGLPCIATDIGGVRDLIRHGTDGCLVPPGSAAALAESMNHAAAHPGTREGWAGLARQKIGEQYDIGRITDRYAELYSSLSGPR